MPEPANAKPFNIKGWLITGAVREDDLGSIWGVDKGDDPHDDPYGTFFRVYHHFFDPTKTLPQDQALNTSLPTPNPGTSIHASPNWALGTLDALQQARYMNWAGVITSQSRMPAKPCIGR